MLEQGHSDYSKADVFSKLILLRLVRMYMAFIRPVKVISFRQIDILPIMFWYSERGLIYPPDTIVI